MIGARTPLASDPQHASEHPHPYQCKLLSSVKSCTHRWQSPAGSASVPDDLRVSSLWLSDLAWPDTQLLAFLAKHDLGGVGEA